MPALLLLYRMAQMLEEEDEDAGFYQEHFGTDIFEEGNDSEFTSEGESEAIQIEFREKAGGKH